MRINELKIGDTTTITLLVKSATTKMTKAPKPYLFMELTDGYQTILANNWDYGDATPPIKNTILSITANVTEWLGAKQLNVKSMRVDKDASVAQFAPKGDFDLTDYVQRAKYLIEEVRNPHIKEILNRAFNDNAALWKTIPSAKGIHHAFVAGNLKHSVDVAVKAHALARVMPEANVDLCIAGGLLQDLGKLWTYELNGAVIEMTIYGQLIEHLMIGAIRLEAYRTPENTKIVDLLQHMISSHHGKLEYGSPTTPMFLEAWIVQHCDSLDAKAQHIKELNDKVAEDAIQMERSYILENRQMLTFDYIAELMA